MLRPLFKQKITYRYTSNENISNMKVVKKATIIVVSLIFVSRLAHAYTYG